MSYIVDDIINTIETLKKEKKYDEAMKIVNHVLIKDPANEQALLQVADIQYRKWDMWSASKAVDRLNHNRNNNDPVWLYVKGVIEMEQQKWYEAKQYLKDAVRLSKFENHEIVRCFWLCEYWFGNRTKWLELIEQAFEINPYDAEVLYNLIELYTLEHRFKKSKHYLSYYLKNHKKLLTFDKDIAYYDNKITLLEQYNQIKLS